MRLWHEWLLFEFGYRMLITQTSVAVAMARDIIRIQRALAHVEVATQSRARASRVFVLGPGVRAWACVSTLCMNIHCQ